MSPHVEVRRKSFPKTPKMVTDEDEFLFDDFNDQAIMDIDLQVSTKPLPQSDLKFKQPDQQPVQEKAVSHGYSIDLDMLQDYYQRAFPAELMYQFLQSNFSYREFSFTLAGDIYVRFKSFNTLAEFKQDLVKSRPIKIGFYH